MTLDEKGAYLSVYQGILIAHQQALEEQKASYEEQVDKIKANFSLMVLGIQGACLGVMVTAFLATGFTVSQFWQYIAMFFFSIVTTIITLVNKGYLKGVGWKYIAEVLNPFKGKAPAPVEAAISKIPDAPKLATPTQKADPTTPPVSTSSVTR